jgi:hypothetical protein
VLLSYNSITQQIPVVLHVTGNPREKQFRKFWWQKIWFQAHGQSLREASMAIDQKNISSEPIGGFDWFVAEGDPDDTENIKDAGLGGVWTDRRGWLSWKRMCKSTEEKIFKVPDEEWFHPKPEWSKSEPMEDKEPEEIVELPKQAAVVVEDGQPRPGAEGDVKPHSDDQATAGGLRGAGQITASKADGDAVDQAPPSSPPAQAASSEVDSGLDEKATPNPDGALPGQLVPAAQAGAVDGAPSATLEVNKAADGQAAPHPDVALPGQLVPAAQAEMAKDGRAPSPSNPDDAGQVGISPSTVPLAHQAPPATPTALPTDP